MYRSATTNKYYLNCTHPEDPSSICTFGLPTTVVTDNGTQFVSEEFEQFLKNNEIRHISSAPYHPATNGLAERAVQIFKAGMRKITDGSTADCIARILLNYQRTPQTTTGSSPAELMFGRNLRTRLDLLLPNLSARVEQSQSRQKQGHDVHARDRTFTAGSKVFVRDFRGPTNWVPGTILNKFGTYSYSVLLDGAGILVRRHADHIRGYPLDDVPTRQVISDLPVTSTPSVTETSASTDEPVEKIPSPVKIADRYPTQTRRPPDRFSF